MPGPFTEHNSGSLYVEKYGWPNGRNEKIFTKK